MEACALVLEQLDGGGGGMGGGGGGKDARRPPSAAATAATTAAAAGSGSSSAPPTAVAVVPPPSPLLPVVNERGELISPAYATTAATTAASATSTSSSSSSSSASSPRALAPPPGAADETELTRALLADTAVSSDASSSTAETTTTTAATTASPSKEKKGRSVLFGASMGLVVAAWVYSGNYLFTSLFTLMTALGQLEYYRTVMAAGIYPARRISVVGACAMFVTASFAPDLHQICLPVASTWAMIWFLTMRRSVSTISEIATTFTGMFYLGERERESGFIFYFFFACDSGAFCSESSPRLVLTNPLVLSFATSRQDTFRRFGSGEPYISLLCAFSRINRT
jgi:hypothetical protein